MAEFKFNTDCGEITENISFESIEHDKIQLEGENGTIWVVPNWNRFKVYILNDSGIVNIKTDELVFTFLDSLFLDQNLSGVSDFFRGYWSSNYVVWRSYMKHPQVFTEFFAE